MKMPFDFEHNMKIATSGGKKLSFKLDRLMAPPGGKIEFKGDFDPGFTAGLKGKEQAHERVEKNIGELSRLQDMLFAQNTYGVLIIFQALDAAGKDGVIKHVMSGVNPQGCMVTSFKVPSVEELDHDYLWRAARALPGRGTIGIFNRPYYEEVLVVRVHPEFLARQNLPPWAGGKDLWATRYEQINCFEKYLVENGIIVLKFFLNVSKEEQRKSFLSRIEEPEKNWKFSEADSRERAHWSEYQAAYREMIERTSTPGAPWFVIPADHKWFTRLAVSEVIIESLRSLDLRYPKIGKPQREALGKIREQLEAER